MSLAPQGRTGRSRQRVAGRDRPRGTCSGAGSACLASPILPVFGAAAARAGTTDRGAARPRGLMVQRGRQARGPCPARGEGLGAPTWDPRQLPALIAFLGKAPASSPFCPRILITEAAHLHASTAHSPRLGTAPQLTQSLRPRPSEKETPAPAPQGQDFWHPPGPSALPLARASAGTSVCTGLGALAWLCNAPHPRGGPTPGHSAQAFRGETAPSASLGGADSEGRMQMAPGQPRPRALQVPAMLCCLTES